MFTTSYSRSRQKLRKNVVDTGSKAGPTPVNDTAFVQPLLVYWFTYNHVPT